MPIRGVSLVGGIIAETLSSKKYRRLKIIMTDHVHEEGQGHEDGDGMKNAIQKILVFVNIVANPLAIKAS